MISSQKRNFDEYESSHNVEDIEIENEIGDGFYKNSIKRVKREGIYQN